MHVRCCTTTTTNSRTCFLLRAAAVMTALAVSTVGVAQGQAPPPSAEHPPVTFTEDVAAIVFDHCVSCHRPDGVAPMSLTTYEEVRPWARSIRQAVVTRAMPPWKADSGDVAFSGDRRLSESAIDTLVRWVDAGAPLGDPSRLPPLPPPATAWSMGEPDLVVRMPEAFPVPAEGRDVYRDFVLPLNLDRDVWVKGVDFRPSAPSTHHSLFFVDDTGTAREQEGRDDLPGFAGGMSSFRGLLGNGRGATPGAAADGAEGRRQAARSLGGWVPGDRAYLLPDDLAYFVPQGSDLILSTHFHPSGVETEEASTVALYFAESPPSKAFTAIQLPPLFGALAGIDIPAGDENYTISDSFVIPVAVRAFGSGAHAHYLGRTMTMTATLPDGTNRTLLGIGDWDFNWQGQYQFADYVELPAGTRLDVTITYDNSAGNPRRPSESPIRVDWGEQSTDEMGSVSLFVAAADETELPELQQAYRDHLRGRAREAMFSGTLQRLFSGR